MGTGIIDVVGGHNDFLPPRSDRSDEFQKLCLSRRTTVANRYYKIYLSDVSFHWYWTNDNVQAW
jgi:hypothetical protein